MKKTFALVLAVAMVMSLAAVSFAAAPTGEQNDAFTLTKAAKYDGDVDSGLGAIQIATGANSSTTIQYGKAAYFQILLGSKALVDYSDVEKLKVKAKWEMGSDLVESLSIVKKRVAAENGKKYMKDGVEKTIINQAVIDAIDESTFSNYAYFVELKTKAKDAVTDADIVGTLTFNKKKSDESTWTLDDKELDITVNVFYENNWNQSASTLLIAGDKEDLKYDTKYLLKFDYDDEVELSFGNAKGGNNEGTFTVDVSGQGKIALEYNTKADDAIVAANAGAKLKFISFNGAKFNRTGEFAYEWEDGKYAYQIVDGKLTAIPGCEYDESDETFYFNTRVLGSYVFSDVELVDAAPAVTAPTETTPVVNPGTGAAA